MANITKNQVFDAWRVLDALVLPEAERPGSHGKHARIVSLEIGSAAATQLPWPADQHPAPLGMRWSYTLQCALLDSRRIYEGVLAALATQAHEPLPSYPTRVFDLQFNAAGIPQAQSFALVQGVWVAACITGAGGDLTKLIAGGAAPLVGLSESGDNQIDSGFEGFDTITSSVMQWIETEAERMVREGEHADAAWIRRLLDLVTIQFGLNIGGVDDVLTCRVRCAAIKESVGADQNRDVLTSFAAADLRRMTSRENQSNVGLALLQFLTKGQQDGRLDVRADEASEELAQRLHPSSFPAGRWPSEHALVFSQQLAVNTAWADLKDGAGLFAVNGPPGTGKTTMLRDMVAAVVTERASLLAQQGSTAFTAKESIRLGDRWVPFYRLRPSLRGLSIVVASSNNGAVENITLELPGAAAVPAAVAKRSDYHKDIAQSLLGKLAWGLLAAPLGKSENRQRFLNSVWWGGESAGVHAREGLRAHLCQMRERPEQAQQQWQKAVELFEAACKKEREARAQMSAAADRPSGLARLALVRAQTAERADALQKQHAALLPRLQTLRDQTASIAKDGRQLLSLDEHTHELVRQHQQDKPGLWRGVITLGKSHKAWQEHAKKLMAVLQDVARQMGALDAEQKRVGKEEAELARLLERVEVEHQKAVSLHTASTERIAAEEEAMTLDRAQLGKAWVWSDAPLAERELQEPWASAQWQQARQDVFLAALDVHKAFADLCSVQMIANMGLASDWLSGKRMPQELAQLALESLCMVVPVVSTTFASMPRMCADLGPQSIGWLLMDEAGQALVSHAAPALWRARRAVVVGDPLQLEPVMTVPASVEKAIANACGLPERLWPSFTSAQGLADQASSLGTTVRQANGEDVWVGCPLRVHRRCDEPMFSISNHIAYDDQMVQGKSATQALLPRSAWLHVQGGDAQGNWVVQEGERLEVLLAMLINAHRVDPGDIAMFSPFRDVARELRRLARKYGIDATKSGTVHTAQGKEADVVILVLGSAQDARGARAWAASAPNLLNVAVSRARQRLYVIGDRQCWQGLQFFDDLAKALPSEQMAC